MVQLKRVHNKLQKSFTARIPFEKTAINPPNHAPQPISRALIS
jgi:hypothetical protein